MSKNGFWKQGNAILRRRWLAREKKLSQNSRPPLCARKTAIADQVKQLLHAEGIREAKIQAQEQQAERELCDHCAAYGFCEFVQCGLKGEER